MATKNIFLDDDSETILKKIKEQQHIFNFSAFVQDSLRKYAGSEIDKSSAIKHLSEAEIAIKTAEGAREYWKQVLQEINIKEALEESKRKEEEEEKKREIEYRERMLVVNDYLANLSDDPDKMAEYKQGIKDKKWNSLTGFAEFKLKNNKV